MRQHTDNTTDRGEDWAAASSPRVDGGAVTDAKAETITDVHTIVDSTRRRVDIARRSFALGNGRAAGHSVTITELRGERRFVIDFPVTALDAAIEALVAVRASVVGDLGPGSTQRRNAPMHGSWMPEKRADGRSMRAGRGAR